MIQWIDLTVSKNNAFGSRIKGEWQDVKTIFNVGHILFFGPDGDGALVGTTVGEFYVKESVVEIQLALNGREPARS